MTVCSSNEGHQSTGCACYCCLRLNCVPTETKQTQILEFSFQHGPLPPGCLSLSQCCYLNDGYPVSCIGCYQSSFHLAYNISHEVSSSQEVSGWITIFLHLCQSVLDACSHYDVANQAFRRSLRPSHVFSRFKSLKVHRLMLMPYHSASTR